VVEDFGPFERSCRHLQRMDASNGVSEGARDRKTREDKSLSPLTDCQTPTICNKGRGAMQTTTHEVRVHIVVASVYRRLRRGRRPETTRVTLQGHGAAEESDTADECGAFEEFDCRVSA
jgi:hypothetical protein